MAFVDVEVEQQQFEQFRFLTGSHALKSFLNRPNEPLDLDLRPPLHVQPLRLSELDRLFGLGTQQINFLEHAVRCGGRLFTVFSGVLDGALPECARLLLSLAAYRVGPVIEGFQSGPRTGDSGTVGNGQGSRAVERGV
ncbi:hypothetical protein [Streptomyces pseudovenezuelae]|uniref:Uncharacterized protein n=1 Tax=Streptomyces pseudovenezuelae TaxID=67350 RepID=A0ABT6LPH4_9ACTN|nr:hypothetical protein [Streptomyces pseudovenezuelae]MDH6218207.1 hypothetical protein [Streptomyces pseudovenezuelae]